MTTHSSILAWKIPWTEEPGGFQSMRSQRLWHDWVTEPTQGGGEKDRSGVKRSGGSCYNYACLKELQEAPTPLLIGPIHVLYLLKSGSVFIYLSIFTKRKIELQNGSNSTLQLLSVNGSRPQMAPHLEQTLHTRTRLITLCPCCWNNWCTPSLWCMFFIITPEESILYGNKCAF